MLTRIPPIITAGDTLQFRQSLPDYPASAGWSLTHTLVSVDGVRTFSGSPAGDDHLVTVSAATTAEYPPGQYSWTASVGNGTERHTVGTGSVTILPNPATVAAADTRTHVKKTLDAIEATIEGRASSDILETQVDGVMLRRMTAEQLIMLRSKYVNWYQQEQAAQRVASGLASGNRILTRFV